MAKITSTQTKVTVSVEVTYTGRHPLDGKRREFMENALQKFADGELAETMRVLRYTGEE